MERKLKIMKKKSIKFEEIFKLKDEWYEYAIGHTITNPVSIVWDRFGLDSDNLEVYIKGEAIMHPERKYTVCRRKRVEGAKYEVKERTYAILAKNIYNIIQEKKLEIN